MAKLIYGLNQSLDGYVDHQNFFPSLAPRDPTLQVSMSQSSPIMTKETTMWRCWVGFHASHSIGLNL
jgi:hypothetical protein